MDYYKNTASCNSITNIDALLGEKDTRAFKGHKELHLPLPVLAPCASTHQLVQSRNRKVKLILSNVTTRPECDPNYYQGPLTLSTLC